MHLYGADAAREPISAFAGTCLLRAGYPVQVDDGARR
jgi:hypothetical protein